jgi:hypothetical protein
VDNVPRFSDDMAEKAAAGHLLSDRRQTAARSRRLNQFPRQNLELSSGIFYTLAG